MSEPLDLCKFCKDCKHCGWEVPADDGSTALMDYEHLVTCDRPSHMIQDLVSGRSFSPFKCRNMRDDFNLCGLEAKWFEPKALAP